MNGQEVLAMESPVIEDLAEGVSGTYTVIERVIKNTSLGQNHYDFLQLDTRAAELGMQSYGRSYFCLLNVSSGCV